jgi:hypothetical protein
MLLTSIVGACPRVTSGMAGEISTSVHASMTMSFTPFGFGADHGDHRHGVESFAFRFRCG